MKTCRNCFRHYKDTANFCVFCGVPVTTDEPVAESNNKKEFKVKISYAIGSDTKEIEQHTFPALIGRDSSSVDIPILDPSVSRKHCKLSLRGETVILEDVGSSNGTFVNGQRISEATPITADDELTIGKIKAAICVDSNTSVEEG